MKKSIIFILISVVFLALSCQKDSKIEIYDLGSEFLISSAGLTSLDNQATISINNISKNLTSISVSHNGIVNADGDDVTPASLDLGSISISASEGSVALTDVQLGISSIGWKANLVLESEFSGKPILRTYSLTVKNPFTTVDPGITHRDDTAYYFKYAVKPITATVGTVSIETKVNYDGVYASVAGSWEAVDSVMFTGSDYNIGDTISVKITATAGTKSDTKVSQLIVEPNSYKNTDSFTLTFDLFNGATSFFDLIEANEVTNATDSADVYTGIWGPPANPEETIYALGSANNCEFLEGTDEDYANADMLAISTTDYSTASNVTGSITLGDVFLYRTSRSAVPGTYYYGILKVISIETSDDGLEMTTMTLEYKH